MTHEMNKWVMSCYFVLGERSTQPWLVLSEMFAKFHYYEFTAGPRFVGGKELIDINLEVASINQEQAFEDGMVALCHIAIELGIHIDPATTMIRPYPLKRIETPLIYGLIGIDDGETVPMSMVDKQILQGVNDAIDDICKSYGVPKSRWHTDMAYRRFENLHISFYRSREYIMFKIHATQTGKVQVLGMAMMTPATLRELLSTMLFESV